MMPYQLDTGNQTLAAPDFLFVIGNPATGKSTISKMILALLTLPRENYFPIDHAHHVLCDPKVKSESYSYTDSGLLVFHDREAMIRDALQWLATESRKTIAQPNAVRPAVLEFSHFDYDLAFSILGNDMVDRGAVLEVVAPFEVARRRNETRPAAHQVPEEYLHLAFQRQEPALFKHYAPNRYVQLLNDFLQPSAELEQRLRNALKQLGL